MRCWNTRQKTTTVCGRLDKRIRLTTKQSSSLSAGEGAALEAYHPHPEHQRVPQNFVNPIRAAVLALDYEF